MAERNRAERRRTGLVPGYAKPRKSWFKPGNTIGFKKGESGNPGGKPKQVREVEELARGHSLEAIEKLADIALSGPDMRVQLAAIEALLDRALGKPSPAPVDEWEDGIGYLDETTGTAPRFPHEEEK